MEITTANERIKQTIKTMNQVMGEPVFDEWAIAEKTASGWKILVYEGDRKDKFLSEFNTDIAALHETLNPATATIGDFAFSHEGYGSGFDAHICVGDRHFALFNNTQKNTDEITQNEKWKQAQIHFAQLTEEFIADPANPTT